MSTGINFSWGYIMPNSVSGLNLYDADKFRAFGEQVLKESKDIIDGKKAQGTPEVQDVPVVPENNDDQNNGLDITSFSRNKSADNSAASNIYDDVQTRSVRKGLRLIVYGLFNRLGIIVLRIKDEHLTAVLGVYGSTEQADAE